jgi:hypothetical protein
MDPTVSIDLKSVAGIVAFTILIVNYAKGWLGQQPILKGIPVSAYVVFVSLGLTFGVHEFRPAWLPGDLGDLLSQALMQALVASGAVEWFRHGRKPAAASSAARARRNGGIYLVPILLAVGLAAGCAGKSKAIAVQADATIYTILSSVQTGADQLQAGGVITADERRALSPALLKALKLGRSFNEAVSASTPLEAIAPLLDAIRELQEVIRKIVPASAQGALLSKLDRAAGLLPAGGQ